MISRVSHDVLWVGLGIPKQERWMHACMSAAAKNWSTLAAECGPAGWLRSVE